ncbi:MAG: hypothetical protein AAGG72_03840, partial [Pseudomonadota bacterium]
GRFSDIRFRPVGGNLEAQSARVTYANGQTDSIRVRDTLRDGRASEPLDLDGRRRRIEKVALSYRNNDFRRLARWVEVWGRAGAPRRDDNSDDDRLAGWTQSGVFPIAIRARERSAEFPRGSRTRQLGLAAQGRRVYVDNVNVRFRNGDRRSFNIDKLIRPRDGIIAIDLPRSDIRNVSVEYQGRRVDSDRGGQLVLLQRQPDRARERAPDRGRDRFPAPRADRDQRGDWVLLGTGKAAVLSRDFDAINIGRNAGRFSAIRIAARRQDIRMYGMRVIYGNGAREEVPVFGWIRKGQQSNVFDLKGRERIIKSVEFRYRTKLSLKGSGRIDVYGLR